MNRRNFLKTIGLTAAVPIVANIKVEPTNTGSVRKYAQEITKSENTPFKGNSWTKKAISEAKNNSPFSKLGERMPMPECHGDTIVKYHDMLILEPTLTVEEAGFYMKCDKLC